jgi:hypothetical protein
MSLELLAPYTSKAIETPTYVDLRILKSLLQVFVYGFVRYRAQERKIRDSYLLLLGAFKDSFLDLWSSPAAARRLLCGCGILLAASALRNCLSCQYKLAALQVV